MDQSGKPKTRLDLVSGGIGRLAGGLTQLVLGLIAVWFWRDLGLALIFLGLIFLGHGVWRIVSGASAPQKEIKCPHCGEGNTLLADVKEFGCYNCGKPLKLVRR